MSSSIEEICSALGITRSAWNDYIRSGVVTKQSKNKYDIGYVSSEIIRNYKTKVRTLSSQLANSAMKIKRTEEKLMKANGQIQGDDGVIQKPMSEKEKVDLALSRQKLRKIKYENTVREKEVMPIDNVFSFVTSITSEFAASLDPMVGKIKQIIPDMNARTHDEVNKLFARTRNDLARHVEGKTTNELIELFNPDSEGFDDDE